MDVNESIASVILKDAYSVADRIRVKSSSENNKLIENAKKESNELIKVRLLEAQNTASEIIKNKQTLLNLEVKKIKLGAKRQVLDNVYLKVISMLKNLDAKSYLEFIEKLIVKHAEKGQVLTISKNAPIQEKDLLNLKSVKELGLKVNVSSEIDGGITLDGNGFTLDLTFTAIVEDLRRQTQTEIVQKLF